MELNLNAKFAKILNYDPISCMQLYYNQRWTGYLQNPLHAILNNQAATHVTPYARELGMATEDDKGAEPLLSYSPLQPSFGMSRNAPPKGTAAHIRTTFLSRRLQKMSKCGKNMRFTRRLAACVPLFCSCHILTSSVIYY